MIIREQITFERLSNGNKLVRIAGQEFTVEHVPAGGWEVLGQRFKGLADARVAIAQHLKALGATWEI